MFSKYFKISAVIEPRTVMEFFDVLDRYSMSYGNKKGTSSNEDVPLCGLVTDYRTFYEEYMKCVEFYNWLKENGNSI